MADAIAAVKRDYPKSFVRIYQFSGNDKDGCNTSIDLGDRTSVDDAVWEKQPPSGTTLLGAALKKTIEAAGTSQANIVIVTDGGERCLPRLCEVANAELPTKPNLNVELVFTEDALHSDINRLQCVAAAGVKTYRAADVPALKPELPLECEWVGGYLWIPGFFLGVLLVFLAGIAGSFAAALGRNAEKFHQEREDKKSKKLAAESEQQRQTTDATSASVVPIGATAISRKTIGTVTWSLLLLSVVAALVSLAPLACTACGRGTWLTRLLLFADGSFGSKFLPGLFVSFVGWVLLQFWAFLEARQTSRNNAYLEHQQEQANAKRKADDQSRDAVRRTDLLADIKSRKTTLDRDEGLTKEAGALAASRASESGQPASMRQLGDSDSDYAARIAKGERIKSRILLVVTKLSKPSRLKKYADLRWRNYWRLIDELEKDGLVTDNAVSDLQDIFRYWPAYLGRTSVIGGWTAKIDSFEIENIKEPAPTR